MVSPGLVVVLVIPAVLAFAFGLWVFYEMLIDVSERDIYGGQMNRCIEGCQLPPDR